MYLAHRIEHTENTTLQAPARPAYRDERVLSYNDTPFFILKPFHAQCSVTTNLYSPSQPCVFLKYNLYFIKLNLNLYKHNLYFIKYKFNFISSYLRHSFLTCSFTC